MFKVVYNRNFNGCDSPLFRERAHAERWLPLRANHAQALRSDYSVVVSEVPEPQSLNWVPDTWSVVDGYAVPPPEPNTAPANPKQAYGDLKVAVQLVPPALWLAAARGNSEGARKYGAFNWRTTKVESMTYVGAIMRHLAAWIDGEETDPESKEGKHHLDGVAASLAILLDALHGGFLIDNRPPKGPAPKMVLTPRGIEHEASFHMGQPK